MPVPAHPLAVGLFTSCMDTLNDPVQTAWRDLNGQAPDEILLLGDSIYMDYDWGHGHERNKEPKRLPLADFSARMHQRYKAQWLVKSFHAAISNRRVRCIWDDHDFAWNNSRGAGVDTDDELVSQAVQRLTREQFRLWSSELAKMQKGSYPDNPYPAGDVPTNGTPASIAETVRLADGVVLHLTDGRTFREQHGGKLLGDRQRAALDLAFGEDVVHVLASGSDLATWSSYVDLEWLRQWSMSRRILVLSGDIHRPVFRDQRVGRIFEATASAIAQKPGVYPKRRDVFGMLEIDNDGSPGASGGFMNASATAPTLSVTALTAPLTMPFFAVVISASE